MKTSAIVLVNAALSLPVLLGSLWLIAPFSKGIPDVYRTQWALVENWVHPSWQWIVAVAAGGLVGYFLHRKLRASSLGRSFGFWVRCIGWGILFGIGYALILSCNEIVSTMLHDSSTANAILLIPGIPVYLIPYLISAALAQGGWLAVLCGGLCMGMINGVLVGHHAPRQ